MIKPHIYTHLDQHVDSASDNIGNVIYTFTFIFVLIMSLNDYSMLINFSIKAMFTLCYLVCLIMFSSYNLKLYCILCFALVILVIGNILARGKM